MAKKRSKRSNTPRRKSFKQDERLQSARGRLPTYEGKNVFRGYRKRYGVDWPTALRELEMLGVQVDPAYREQVLRTVQEQAEAKKRKRLEKAAELERLSGIEQDEYFAYIIGYTSGGAPYGITWEEWEALDPGAEEDTALRKSAEEGAQ